MYHPEFAHSKLQRPSHFSCTDAQKSWFEYMQLFDDTWLTEDRKNNGYLRSVSERTWAFCKLCTGEWNLPRTMDHMKKHARERHLELLE